MFCQHAGGCHIEDAHTAVLKSTCKYLLGCVVGEGTWALLRRREVI